ncbi:all-trans retinoic acid-induced differentiation factor [Melanotaenia boesemani]|uniref:all-trans retinoic acid-induced differentiation factor n=1 Tax=Melanotaenia boesemani TaxID=1250792 RepID=UPI001C04C1BE|nr:all-trans retinoic acid-induced differentiation factor [Melanotaenia boesemani]
MKMKAQCCWIEPIVFILIFKACFNASNQLTKQQVCCLCGGTVLNGTMVGQFCSSSAGRIDGRCCIKNNTDDPEHIIGLDLSNCSLTHVDYIQGADTASIIDLSLNPIVNISDTAFQGFRDLNYMILPQDMNCPGGNASWQQIEVKYGNRYCEGQLNMCNQTGQLSMNCPENSLCAPYGPGFYECSCAEKYHGYKCLREGEFPALQVFGPLAASTVVISFLLWATQRRKAKSV